MIRAGVIRNLKSHRNQGGAPASVPAGVLEVKAGEPDELHETLAWFAKSGVELVVIDGGDGTIRDVLSRLPPAYVKTPPRFAVLPRGKTNALALDLGMSGTAPLEAVLAAAAAGRTKTRPCLEIMRAGAKAPDLRGFLFGLGAFVRGTELAQKTHGLGFFDNAAIGLTILGAAARTLAGGPQDPWRRGETASLTLGEGPAETRAWFLAVASTLKRFPLGLKPYGPPHEGLKVLTIEAPPPKLPTAAALIFAGSEAPWLEKRGYRRTDTTRLGVEAEGSFVLDGELFPTGGLTVRQGSDLEFVIA